MKVIKRDGREVPFDKEKIKTAILRAMKNGSGIVRPKIAEAIADEIEIELSEHDKTNIKDIEAMVFDKLITKKQRLTARAYEGYRSVREFQRNSKNTTDETLKELVSGTSEYWNTENSNKGAELVTVQRDYIAGIASTDYARRVMFPPEVIQAHDDGIIHIHDMDYMLQQALHNCDLINMDDMLQNGTVLNEKMIEKPHRFATACTIATQIIMAVSSSQYGGCTMTLTDLAPFVRDSREAIRKEVLAEAELLGNTQPDIVEKIVMERLRKEINAGVQTFNYQVNSMFTTNGQSPFLSVNMYLGETDEYKDELAMIIEEFLKQRIIGIKNEVGVYVTQEFPKLLYVLEEDNIHEDSKYWYLTELAAKCTAKRMVPDYISEKIMLEYKGDCYPCMGCRSFLTPDRSYTKGNLAKAKNYAEGNHKYYGRFNCGVVTLNLPDIALSSEGDFDKFWEIFDERLELCHTALQCKHKKLRGIKSDVAPILWQYGALARLDKGEEITPLLFDGYSTISLGFCGLYECVKYMTGKSHTDPDAKPFALKVMQHLNDACAKWKAEENIDYSVYGSPIETTTDKFAKALKRRFGEVEGITDKGYVTNSYHVEVTEEINPFQKLAFEAEFQRLAPGGAISYIETADMTNNPEAVIEVMKFIYDHIMYAELNTKSDYCQVCGYDGEIKVRDEDGQIIWECPQCGNTDQSKMNVARRTCGYIGSHFWSRGRSLEIMNRYVHLDDHEHEL